MKLKKWLALTAALMMTTGTLFAAEAAIDGAEPGKWTMDLDAAKQVAAEKDLPILLNFTGSDWCGWCKLMEEQVFTKDTWKEYATENIMMVFIDFPQDKSLVPDKYVERNTTLSRQHGITGYPTYIILDSDGTTKLGQLGADEDKTPEKFIAEIKATLSNSASAQAAFLETLSPEKKAEYEKLNDQLNAEEKKLEKQNTLIEEAENKAEEIQIAIMKAQGAIEVFKKEQQLSPEKFKEYKEIRDKYDAAIEEITQWLATHPEQDEKMFERYQREVKEIQALEAKLSEY